MFVETADAFRAKVGKPSTLSHTPLDPYTPLPTPLTHFIPKTHSPQTLSLHLTHHTLHPYLVECYRMQDVAAVRYAHLLYEWTHFDI